MGVGAATSSWDNISSANVYRCILQVLMFAFHVADQYSVDGQENSAATRRRLITFSMHALPQPVLSHWTASYNSG